MPSPCAPSLSASASLVFPMPGTPVPREKPPGPAPSLCKSGLELLELPFPADQGLSLHRPIQYPVVTGRRSSVAPLDLRGHPARRARSPDEQRSGEREQEQERPQAGADEAPQQAADVVHQGVVPRDLVVPPLDGVPSPGRDADGRSAGTLHAIADDRDALDARLSRFVDFYG